MKFNPEYFHPGKHHVCPLCGTAIGKVVGNTIRPLGNKAHILMRKENGGIYSFNACVRCAKKKIDFKDKRTITLIHHNSIFAREFLDRLQGKSEKWIKAQRRDRLSYKPNKKNPKVIVELDDKERKKNIISLLKDKRK